MTESTPGERGQLEGREERTQEYAEHFNMTPVEPGQSIADVAARNGAYDLKPTEYESTRKCVPVDFERLANDLQKLQAALAMHGVERVHYWLPPLDAEGTQQVLTYLKAGLGDDFKRVIVQPG